MKFKKLQYYTSAMKKIKQNTNGEKIPLSSRIFGLKNLYFILIYGGKNKRKFGRIVERLKIIKIQKQYRVFEKFYVRFYRLLLYFDRCLAAYQFEK